MATYHLCHRHTASECAVAFAAWKGFHSPLRRCVTLASCAGGDHQIWWIVDADDPDGALILLPPYVARRSEAIPVRQTMIP